MNAPTLGRRGFIARLGAALAGLFIPGRVTADTLSIDPYLGEIMLFPFDFAPNGWVKCNGHFLPIVSYQNLFALIGTTYGGDGVTNFRLPDLRGRTPLHWGQGPGLTERYRGAGGGASNLALNVDELPAHTHAVRASSLNGTSASPAGMFPAASAAGVPRFAGTANTQMAPNISDTGSGQVHSNTQPFLALNYCICINGVFPPQ